MMNRLTDEEKYLILGKVTGALTPEEEAMAEALLLGNPDAHPAYEELTKALPPEDVKTQFARHKQGTSWKDITAIIKERQADVQPVIKYTPFYKRKWIWAAAVATGLLLGTGVLWKNFTASSDTSITAINRKKPSIELKLANGKVINLSRDTGTINAGPVQLNNNVNSLSYSINNTEDNKSVNTLIVPVGMDYKIKLADGSEVWLNSATRLQFPLNFTGNSREITINGEAYLKVAKNVTKPFIVHLPQSTVQVLGTEFNVNTYDSGLVKVSLVEGLVDMKAVSGKTRLSPGRQAIFRQGQDIEQSSFDARKVLSWRQGLFYFEDASLEDIIKVVLRWYGTEGIIDNPSILSRHFTGIINRNRSIDVFQDDLKAISGINSHIDKNGLIHFY